MYIFVVLAEKLGDSFKVEIPHFEESFIFTSDCETAMLEQAAFFLKCRVMKCLLLHEEVPQNKCPDRKNNKQQRYTLAVQVELPEDRLFSINEIKCILGVSQARVSGLIHDKRLDALKRGHYRLITRESLEAYLKTPRKPGRPPQSLASQLEHTTAIQQ